MYRFTLVNSVPIFVPTTAPGLETETESPSGLSRFFGPEAADVAQAFGDSAEERAAVTAGAEGNAAQMKVLVGLREEGLRARLARVLVNGDPDVYIAGRPRLLNRKAVQFGQAFGRGLSLS